MVPSNARPEPADEQARLKAERDDLLALLDAAPALIGITRGPEHVFSFANQALRAHLDGRDPVGHPLRKALPDWADRPIHEAMDCVFGNGEPARGLYVPLTGAAAGERMDFVHLPVRDPEGNVDGVVTFAVEAGVRRQELEDREAELARREASLLAREASLLAREASLLAREASLGLAPGEADEALARAFEALRRADAQRDALLDVVSHELRSPIHVMMGYGAILRGSVADRLTRAERRHLDQMLQATDDLASVVNDLLDLGAIRSGKLALRPRLVDIRVLIDEAVADHAAEAREKALDVTTCVASDLPPLVADAGRVVQVLGELLENAIRYTPEGGQVVVRADARAGALVCQVEDSGVGIPPEALPTIFEPFGRIDTSLTRAGGGLGTGLALSKGLAEAHGGSVAVTSVPGRGSTFEVRLPFAGPGVERLDA